MSESDDATPRGEEQQKESTEDTETTMSEANSTTEDEQNEYQVAVWAKRELIVRVEADTEDEAKYDVGREQVISEHGIDSDNILSSTHEAKLGNEHQVSYWVEQEFVETVTANSEEQAEDEAADRVCMEYDIQTRDVKSTNVEAVR